MDVRSQVSMLFHLDKCIGCHTCSIACKNIWTDRKGAELRQNPVQDTRQSGKIRIFIKADGKRAAKVFH